MVLPSTSKTKYAPKTNDYFMNVALKEAGKAYEKGEVPIGAIIVKDGIIISRGHNEKETKRDSTLHAEMTAIKRAAKKLNSWHLDGCDMYVTLEPCSMCAGALIHSRIKRLYIGAQDPKAGAVGSVINVLQPDLFNHNVEVYCGVLEEECSKILKKFFRDLRQSKNK